MTTETRQYPMTLRLSERLLENLDLVSQQLRMSRSAYIRRAIRKELQHSLKNELPLIRDPAIQEALMR